jgi:hypothetical protein
LHACACLPPDPPMTVLVSALVRVPADPLPMAGACPPACADRDDPSVVKASGYCLVVEPVAGARPTVVSTLTLDARLEKGLDDVWRVKRLSFADVHGST